MVLFIEILDMMHCISRFIMMILITICSCLVVEPLWTLTPKLESALDELRLQIEELRLTEVGLIYRKFPRHFL